MLPVSTCGKFGLLPKVAGDELAPLHEVVVDGRYVPPLVLAGNRHVLLSVSAVDGHVLTCARAGRKRGLLLT